MDVSIAELSGVSFCFHSRYHNYVWVIPCEINMKK